MVLFYNISVFNVFSASDAEFYKNLRQISGENESNLHEDSPVEDLSDDAAKKLADDIGNLDDLDDDLFSGLRGSSSKKTPKKKTEGIKPRD